MTFACPGLSTVKPSDLAASGPITPLSAATISASLQMQRKRVSFMNKAGQCSKKTSSEAVHLDLVL